MKRRFVFLGIIFLLIVGFLFYRDLKFNINNSNYVLIGDNDNFDASVVTDGRDTFYMWNKRLHHNSSGSMNIEVTYIGAKEYGPGTEVSYQINLTTVGGERHYYPDEDENFNPIIISSSKDNYLRSIPDDLSIRIRIGEDDYVIHFYEQ